MFNKTLTVAVLVVGITQAHASNQSAASLNDLEIAHVAYTADNVDIRYAHLAMAKSKNPAIQAFAKTMIRDHEAVNAKALELLKKLDAAPQDNFLSRKLNAQADQLVAEMSQLEGEAFDRRYALNELAYHRAVNTLVADTFIPNIDNAEMKALFQEALTIFRIHEKHAEMTANEVQ